MTGQPPTPGTPDRSDLMAQHVAARERRDAAALGTDEFRLASEEVARIEIAIAALEEPPIVVEPEVRSG